MIVLQKLVFASALLISMNRLIAQENPEIKKLRISELTFQVGGIGNLSTSESFNSLRPLAPNSLLLSNAPSQYSESESFTFNSGLVTSMLLGISFRNHEKNGYKPRPTLRLGLIYSSNSGLSASIFNENRKAFDTLSSNQTGQILYVDSVVTRNYFIDYISEQIRLDASLIFRSNKKNRLTAMTGIGFTTGLSLNSTTSVRYNKYSRTESYSSSDNYINNFNGDNERSTEIVKNKTSFGYSMFVPVGLDFQLGKTHLFWKNAHFFYELRSGVNFTSVPELKLFSNAYMQHGFGLRISI